MTASPTLAESTQRRPAQSLQARLTGTVLAMVFLVWTVVAVATWHDTEHEVGELLDAHLSQAASLLVSQPLDDLSRINLQELSHPARIPAEGRVAGLARRRWWSGRPRHRFSP